MLRRVRSWKQPSIHCERAAITVLASTCIDMHTLSRLLNLGTFPATVAPGVCMLWDDDRYYSGSVYVEALLHLSGGYRACDHSEDKVYANAALNLVGFVCASKSNRLYTRKEVVIVVPFLFTLYPPTITNAQLPSQMPPF